VNCFDLARGQQAVKLVFFWGVWIDWEVVDAHLFDLVTHLDMHPLLLVKMVHRDKAIVSHEEELVQLNEAREELHVVGDCEVLVATPVQSGAAGNMFGIANYS